MHSADGTAIEYLSNGNGPPVLLIPGALATASGLLPLAAPLARQYTVHIVQRRGRGGSGPQGDQYGIERECEDVEAIRAATGARLLFGHSFGAFLTFIRGVNPDQTGRLPRWLLRVILPLVIPRAQLRQNLALMPQAINEHVEVGRLATRLADYRGVTAAALIMRGKGRDAGWQAVGLSRLAETIPWAQTEVFGHLDHFAPEKKPAEIADTLLRFFAAPAHPRPPAP
ncbi:MAG TPA: alpha/beta hydrolase family protein [Trebonia sp.]